MRALSGWKRPLFILITVVIAIRIGYIAFRGEIDKEYYASAEYDLTGAASIPCSGATQIFSSGQDRLNSLELIFTNIPEDRAGALLALISSGGERIYQTNISLANINDLEWKKVFVNAELSPDREYMLTLTPNEDCTNVPDLLVVKNGHAPEITASYVNDRSVDGQIAVNYGYLRSPSVLDRCVAISLWVLLWAAVLVGLLYLDPARNVFRRWIGRVTQHIDPRILAALFELFCVTVIVNCSGIPFQAATKIVLYAVSLIAVADIQQKSAYVKGLTDALWKRASLILLYLYAAFALVGQRIFLYPLTLKVTAAGIFVYLCTVSWSVPVVQSVLYHLERASSSAVSEKRGLKTWQFILFSAAALLLPAAYNLFAFNPGISSSDTVLCMDAAHHLQGMIDWHPAFYCMVLSVIQAVWDSTYAVILVQYFFWTSVILELMLYLRKKGMKEPVLMAVALFMGLNAGNYLFLDTIWKDIPYAISLLWSFTIVAKLCIDHEEYEHKWGVYLELIVALVGIFFYRKNGVVPFILISVSLALTLRKDLKALASIVVSLLLIFTIKGPVYQHFEVEDPGKYGMYIGLGQDILGAYYAGGEVSERTLQMINVMTYYNDSEFSYDPTWAEQSYYLDVGVKEFVFNYIDTFLKDPVAMLRAVIDREDALWDIFAGQDTTLGCVNYTFSMDDDEDWHYPARQYVSLYPIASAAVAYTADSQWISAIVWRNGLFTLLGAISFLFLLFKNAGGKHLIVVVPAVGQVLSLLLSTGWSDQRYFWPITLLNQALILLTIVIIHEKNSLEGTKRS